MFLALYSQATAQIQWDEIVYHYQTGSVPPPYYSSYDLTINSTGTGTLVYSPNYGNDTNWVYKLCFSEESMKKINETITRSNVLNETIPALPDSLRPIGGSLQNISVQLPQDPSLDQTPPRIITPYFPEESYKETLEGIYSVIKEAVPKNIWDEINTKKEEYQKSRDK